MKKPLECKNDLLKWYIKTRVKEATQNGNSTVYKTPLAFSFLLTNRCILRCKHCFYHKTISSKQSNEMTFNDYVKLSNNLGSFIYAFFCGGEPFLREDVHEIIRLFQQNNNVIWTNSTTNGQQTEKVFNSVQKIVEDNNKFFNLNFSFEGPQEINDQIRGKGTFKRALRTFKECAKLRQYNPNFKLGITTTMCSINQDYLDSFFNWAIDELKPDQINCLMIRQDPRGGIELKDVKIENFKNVSKTLLQIRGKINSDEDNVFYHQLSTMNDLVYKTRVSGEKQFVCYAGVHGAFIDYDGTVNVCEVFCDSNINQLDSKSMGVLKDFDMDFHKLWNSDKANEIRAQVNKNKVCHQCTHETEGLIPSLLIEPNPLAQYIK